MITLISLCNLFWLLWLIPLLLGMLLWWLGNNKYNGMVEEYEGKIKGLNGRIKGLEGDLSECGSKRANLEGDLAVTKGRMREMESDMKSLKAAASSNKGGQDQKEVKGNKSNKTSFGDGKDGNTEKSSGNDNIAPMTSAADSGIDATSSLTGFAAGAGSGFAGNSNDTETDKSPPTKSPPTKSIYSGVKDDNFQIIEGIGPKMESILKENGVNNFSSLAEKSPTDLRAILNKYGDKYKIIDPATWAQQAGYAAESEFEGLIDLQKKLDGGKKNAVGMSDSKLEKYLIKTGAIKTFKQDDLKAIEGVGPATEKLLHENGIKTWRELANTDASKIKAILTTAGSRFALGDPTTWPKQAEMAADGKFDELKEYQDFLDGGRG